MNVIVRSELFDQWLAGLSDQQGKARIVARLKSAELGNFGDCESVGEGVSEMRFITGRAIEFILSGTALPSTWS